MPRHLHRESQRRHRRIKTMDVDLLQVISRWVHVGTAIVLLGGSVFQKFVLLPPLRTLPETAQQDLRDRIVMRWKKYVMWGIALLLLTGFYNYLRTSHP